MPVQTSYGFEDSITENEWKVLCSIFFFQNGTFHPEYGKIIPPYGSCGLIINGKWVDSVRGISVKNFISETLHNNGLSAQDYINWHRSTYP